jgi:hypothetical protein
MDAAIINGEVAAMPRQQSWSFLAAVVDGDGRNSNRDVVEDCF